MPRGLVVFYSLTGHTREVAEDLAVESGWDLAEIHDARLRQGGWAMVRSVFEAVTGRCPPIRYSGPNPRGYDLVVMATPNWCGRVAAPVRSFIKEYGNWLSRVGIVVTSGGLQGGDATARQLEDLLGWELSAELLVADAEIEAVGYRDRIKAFIERLEPARRLEMAAQ